MTIETTVNKTIQSGNGSNKDFDFAFEIPDEDSLSLTKRGSDGTETAITTNYTVTGIGDEAGGTVNYPTSGSALASNEKIIIKRVVALKQLENLRNQGDYSLEDIEDALDRAVMLCQQLQEQVDRCLKLNLTSSSTYVSVDDFVANKLLVVSADGQSIEMSSAAYGSIDAYLSTLVAIAADISAVAAIDTEVTTVAGIDTEVTTVAGIAAAVTSVAAIAANVSTVAAISANVTTVAGMSSNIASVVTNMASILNAASFGFPTLASEDENKMLQINAAFNGYNAVKPLSRKNVLMNGDALVWQRGTSFSSIANNTVFADRWRYRKSGAMVHDVTRSTDVPTVAQAGRTIPYSIKIDCTTIDSSIAAGDFCFITQRVEGYRFAQTIAQKASVAHFWVKAPKTGKFCIAHNNSGNDRGYVSEYTVSAADTWEKKTVNVAASPSAGTWVYDNGIGIDFNVILAAGSTFHTTAGAWQTGIFLATSNQVNACDNTANDFYITEIMWEEGSQPTSFEALPFGEALRDCQRYYEKSYNIDINPGTFTTKGLLSLATNSSGAYTTSGSSVMFRTTKRNSPTISFYDAVGNVGKISNYYNGGRVDNNSGQAVLYSGCNNFSLYGSNAVGPTIHYVADSEL